ncbi:MAG: hypothetical protein ACMUHU_00305 [Thermoplasmatota archaeon]
MEKYRGNGQIHIHGGLPYSDKFSMESFYTSYEQDRCPRCGSRHVTIFNNVVTNQRDGKPVSGDLRFGTLVVGKCLSCGIQLPMRFKCIREA